MKKEFTTSLDSTTLAITIAAVCLLVSVSGFTGWRMISSETLGATGPLMVIVIVMLPLLIVGGTWAFRVLGYEIDEEFMTIRRFARNRVIRLQDIEKLIVPPEGTMRLSFRAFGNGGLFGFTGYFTNTKFGWMRWYTTRRSNYVILEMKDGEKIVLTPDDMALADAVTKQAGLTPNG